MSLPLKRIKHFDDELYTVPDSLNTTESFLPLVTGPIKSPIKPTNIPVLDLRKVQVV